MLDNAWIHQGEPYTNEELKKLGRVDLITEPDEVEETTSQFQACVDQIILQPYKETIHE